MTTSVDITDMDHSQDLLMTQKFLMIALWKANGNKVLEITDADVKEFLAAHPDAATVFYHMHPHSFEIGVLNLKEAQDRATLATAEKGPTQ